MEGTGVSGEEFDDLFRRESRRLVSMLTGILGPRNLELAEDVVQESFVRALDRWPQQGVPDNPGAWLLTTARNRALDILRRESGRSQALDGRVGAAEPAREAAVDGPVPDERALHDDQLRMIFMCCDPSIRPENRTPLILKTLCGLSVPAVARALLTTESTINKRLYRTRRQLRDVEFGLPDPDQLPTAVATVHTAMYLVFNEGYLASGDEPIRRELCREALAMTRLLASAPGLANGHTWALFALMCFHTARLDARVDDSGDLVPLDLQDRTRWDRGRIAQGYRALGRAREFDGAPGRYHLEAAIAARHCAAPQFEDTDWGSICRLYDRLFEIAPTPMVELNRAVAISYRDGATAAIPLVDAMRTEGRLPHSHALAAVLANLYARAGRHGPALVHLDEALAGARNEPERRLIRRQIERAREPGD